MRRVTADDLPRPPSGRTGWPWTAPSHPPLETETPAESLPRISIITPSLNQGEYIEETIRGVLLQDYPNVELIVIDGGSTDTTLDTLRRYAPWLAHWSSEPDDGQADAINKGLARATGDIFAWCNSDDLYLPGTLHRVASAFTAHPGIFVSAPVIDVGLRRRQVIGSTRLGFRNLVEFWTPQRAVMRDQGLFYPRSVIAEVGPLDPSFHYVFDYEFLIRVTSRLSPHYLEEPVSTYRFHEGSKTVRFAHRWFDEQLRASKKYWHLLPGLDPAACDRFLAGARLRRGVGALLREPRIGFRLIAQALSSHPWAAIRSSVRYTLRRAGLNITYEEVPADRPS
jgi:glycosyltransferase involved in cell wall biosynthesis